MLCTNGHEMLPGAKFCTVCGAPPAAMETPVDEIEVIETVSTPVRVVEPVAVSEQPIATAVPTQAVSAGVTPENVLVEHANKSLPVKPIAIGLGALALAAAGWFAVTHLFSGGDSGSDIGINAMTRSVGAAAVGNCETFFGGGQNIIRGLGLNNITLTPDAASSTNGWCYYTTQFGDRISLQVSSEQPYGATQFAMGSAGYVALNISPSVYYNTVDATTWLQRRANALTDDYTDWVAALPAMDAGWASVDALYPDGNSGQTTTMTTPYMKVEVTPVGTEEWITLNDGSFRAADGYKIVAADVQLVNQSVAGTSDIPPIRPTLSLIVDGNAADATTLLQPLTDAGSLRRVTVSVPANAGDVELAVTTGSATQAVSLLNGQIEDNGQSASLEQYLKGNASRITNTSARYGTHDIYFDAFQSYIDWTFSAWSSAAQTFAPAGNSFFTVKLGASSPERFEPLNVDDMVAIINGNPIAATAYDPTTYTYTFAIPTDATRVDLQLSTTPTQAAIQNAIYDYQPGQPLTPALSAWTIDLYH